jgi:Ser/Thr protein kinase RdoA (MazF antagonist)
VTPRKVLAENYVRIGAARLAASSAPASNEHFFVATPKGRYFLKQLHRPDSLYEGEGLARLESLGRVLFDLNRAGLPVERLVSTDKGKPLVAAGDSAFRLYKAIDGRAYDGSRADLKKAAAALGTLHKKGKQALSAATEKSLSRFRVPYPLRQTLPRLDRIEAFVRRQNAPACRVLSDEFSAIRDAAGFVKPLVKSSGTEALAHNDFHPGNVLYEGSSAVMIDFDNALLGPADKCAALAVLRFAFYKKPTSAGQLRDTLELWSGPYEKASGRSLGPGLYRWMAAVELEKILRIVERWRRTGDYGRFLPNITGRHFPNLKLALSLQ